MITVYAHRYDSPKWQAYVTPYSDGFTFGDQATVTSLYELKQALTTLPEDVVNQHIQSDPHHIADWIEHVVGDPKLAGAVRQYSHRWGVVVALERQLMRTLNLPHYVAQRWLESKDNSPFTFSSGETVRSLSELNEALKQVSDDTVLFHLERTPNDISKWVNDVIGDYELAELLQDCTHRTQMQRFVEDHLKMLQEAAEIHH